MYLFDSRGGPMGLPPPTQPAAGLQPLARLDARQGIFGAWAGPWAEAAELPSGPRATPCGCGVYLVADDAGVVAGVQTWGPARWALLPTETVVHRFAAQAGLKSEFYPEHFRREYAAGYYSNPVTGARRPAEQIAAAVAAASNPWGAQHWEAARTAARHVPI